MVVDDLPLMRMRIRESLLEAGHEVVEASEGSEAIEFFPQYKPDAVFLDLKMPDMHGVECLRQILQIDPHARVTMVTGDAQRATVESARDVGAVDFILKPFNHQRLLDAVNKMLK